MATTTAAVNNKDAGIRQDSPDTNGGSVSGSSGFYTYSEAGASNIYRLIFHFTLPGGGGTITAIKFYLYKEGKAGTTADDWEIHELTRTNWTEAGCTWNKYDGTNSWTNPGGDFSATVVDSIAREMSTNGWYSWDLIGADATNPIAGLTWGSNVHFMLKLKNESSANYGEWWTSKEGSSNKPYIEITYTPAPSRPLPTLFLP